MQKRTKEAIIALSVAATVILLVAPSEAHAQIAICYSTDACDINHATGNPHSTALPGDPNPGTTDSQSCSGNPHGEIGSDTCHGSH